MLDVIFAHPQTKYDSYTDYRRLAELSGFEIADNIDSVDVNKKALYITCPHNGEVDAAMKARPKNDRKCKVAMWFLERPAYEGSDKFKARTAELLATQLDYIWFSDCSMFKQVCHIPGTMFVPMGSDERLGEIAQNKTYDFCHMSYCWGRRGVINEIEGKLGGNCWGNERHEVLKNTKFMLNIHQDGDNYHEPLRFALCAAYAIPMISEECFDPFPYVAGVDFVPVAYNDIKRRMHEILKEDYNKYIPFGSRMHAKATKEFRFIDNIKKAVIQVSE
jgi:hypothetical protein